jgi:hypothetical protein
MKTLKQLSILTSLAAVSLLTGCDIAEETCTTNADCDTAAGEICANIDATTLEGTCEAPADGSGSGSGSGADCSTDASICTDGQQCDGTQCVTITYNLIAIVSTATDSVGTPNNTPGPDIDAIAIEKGGVPTFADSVKKVINGGFTSSQPNANLDSSKVLGNTDVLFDTSGIVCDVSDTAGYFSLGYGSQPQGIIVVGFPTNFGSGDVAKIYEVGATWCVRDNGDSLPLRDDSFEVYYGPSNADTGAITDRASLLGQGFKLAGGSESQEGGIFPVTIN